MEFRIKFGKKSNTCSQLLRVQQNDYENHSRNLFNHHCTHYKRSKYRLMEQKNYKEIFDFDIMDSNKRKYMSLGSFESHTYCSIAKNGSVAVYQNLGMIF